MRSLPSEGGCRLDLPTPWVQAGRGADCRRPGRICNSWTITDKPCATGRVTVVPINADLGL